MASVQNVNGKQESIDSRLNTLKRYANYHALAIKWGYKSSSDVLVWMLECLDADAWISVYRDNEGLWREISDLRQKHSQQQQIIKKVQKTFFAPNYFTYSVEIELETIFSQ